jgi:hypothetical protein
MRRMMTRVEYVPQGDGMLLVLTKDLRDGGAGECGAGGRGNDKDGVRP